LRAGWLDGVDEAAAEVPSCRSSRCCALKYRPWSREPGRQSNCSSYCTAGGCDLRCGRAGVRQEPERWAANGPSRDGRRFFRRRGNEGGMDPVWRIELLGGLRAQRQEANLSQFRTRKAAELLAYLAYHRRRSHPRELLVELLWPETEVDAGR